MHTYSRIFPPHSAEVILLFLIFLSYIFFSYLLITFPFSPVHEYDLLKEPSECGKNEASGGGWFQNWIRMPGACFGYLRNVSDEIFSCLIINDIRTSFIPLMMMMETTRWWGKWNPNWVPLTKFVPWVIFARVDSINDSYNHFFFFEHWISGNNWAGSDWVQPNRKR